MFNSTQGLTATTNTAKQVMFNDAIKGTDTPVKSGHY